MYCILRCQELRKRRGLICTLALSFSKNEPSCRVHNASAGGPALQSHLSNRLVRVKSGAQDPQARVDAVTALEINQQGGERTTGALSSLSQL